MHDQQLSIPYLTSFYNVHVEKTSILKHSQVRQIHWKDYKEEEQVKIVVRLTWEVLQMEASNSSNRCYDQTQVTVALCQTMQLPKFVLFPL